MLRVALRSLATFALSAFLGSVVIFLALRMLGGDVATVILGQSATPETLAEVREGFGLDRSWVVQYLDWLVDLARGDLGTSFASGYDIGDEIGERILVTVPLVLVSLLIASVIALALGTLAALHARRLRGTAIDVASQIGISIPVFWLGLLLVTLIAVRWKLLPAGGFVPWGVDPLESLRSLVLPCAALVIPLAAMLTRYVRSSMLDVLSEDYIRTARARGRTLASAAVVHGIRNASIPIVTVIGLQMGGLLAGAVVIEVVFNLPGLGQMLVGAVAGREVIVVQSLVFVLLVIILLLNYGTDLLYGVLDPRLRTRRAPAPEPGAAEAAS